MGLETVAMLAPSAIGLVGSLFGGGQNNPIEYSPVNPQMDQFQQQLMPYLMSKIGQPQPYAPINPMSLNAMNMMSSYYLGQPYQHPGLQMYQQPGGQGLAGAFGGFNPGMMNPMQQMPSGYTGRASERQSRVPQQRRSEQK